MAKILIVDDDPDIVETSRIVLENAGHSVYSAGSREDGLEAFDAQAPDLVLLDVMMEEPDDGIAMAQDLRRRGFKGRILMLTSLGKVTGYAYDRDDDLVPVDDFCEKPVPPAELVARVNELLAK